MTTFHPVKCEDNRRVSIFYNRVYWLYPLVDYFCAPGRNRLIKQINAEPAGRLLEIGVGPGRHLPLYKTHQVTAIDCSVKMVSSSRRYSPDSKIFQMDGEALDFPDGSYDYVALCHVLSVTANPSNMLAEAHRVLRPGGRLFVLNHETPTNAWMHIEKLMDPLAGCLRFRSWFRLSDIPGVERFQTKRLEVGGMLGLMNAYCLEK